MCNCILPLELITFISVIISNPDSILGTTMGHILLFLCYSRFHRFQPGIKVLHRIFGRPGDLLRAGISSFGILSNFSTSILVTCWSNSLLLLSTLSLIDWRPQHSLIYWLLISSIFLIHYYTDSGLTLVIVNFSVSSLRILIWDNYWNICI